MSKFRSKKAAQAKAQKMAQAAAERAARRQEKEQAIKLAVTLGSQFLNTYVESMTDLYKTQIQLEEKMISSKDSQGVFLENANANREAGLAALDKLLKFGEEFSKRQHEYNMKQAEYSHIENMASRGYEVVEDDNTETYAEAYEAAREEFAAS